MQSFVVLCCILRKPQAQRTDNNKKNTNYQSSVWIHAFRVQKSVSYEIWCLLHLWSTLYTFAARDVESCPGETVTLPCYSTKRQGVDWRYQRSSASHGSYVVASGHIQKKYEERFSLNQTTEYQRSLVIAEVQLDDQGLYICIEDAGLGPRHEHRLTVHGQSPFCNLIASGSFLHPQSPRG